MPTPRAARWPERAPGGDIHTRSREVVRPTGGIMRCKFPSRKNGRLVHCEGLLELDAAYAFELHPHITRYREQPAKVDFADGAHVRRYTPDFEVTLSSGQTILVEVKPASSLVKPDIQHRLACVRDHMQRHGKLFTILSDDVLRREPLRSNLRLIFHRLVRAMPTRPAAVSALRGCAAAFPMPLSRATETLSGLGMQPYVLMFMGMLTCDLSAPLTPTSLVALTQEDSHGWLRLSPELGF